MSHRASIVVQFASLPTDNGTREWIILLLVPAAAMCVNWLRPWRYSARSRRGPNHYRRRGGCVSERGDRVVEWKKRMREVITWRSRMLTERLLFEFFF
ncbi:hypothetical protein CDAR_57411 [Caerostris darwini]|uniref:Uncharacterized protein n=1 Tax=Caerostris darwini TaxID=1538125 RepID=A0AAV4SZL1_9ARAC|nr:hypothetical protein CDAR_57411 [Caerostris darwini]